MKPKNTRPRISVAPMMDWTDKHCRRFLRLFSDDIILYTEMVTSQAIIHGDRDYLLQFSEAEHPVVLQLGGSDPKQLAQCAAIGEQYGYDEINLNVGCPSDRVQAGRFGACLMKEPKLVADCIAAMQANTSLPVTVKTRIGVDEFDSYDFLVNFIDTVHRSGCNTFILHARKAWLHGLSPKENRDIPPLSYETVHRIKQDFPDLTIVLNGGIQSVYQIEEQLPFVDGVMLGRAAYHNPYILAECHQAFFAEDHMLPNRHQLLEHFIPYIEEQLSNGVQLKHISRHIIGLFQGMPGARSWRRMLSENAHRHNAGINIIRQAVSKIPTSIL